MDKWTRTALEELSGHLASIARRLGELTLTHERLAAERSGRDPEDEVEAPDAAVPPRIPEPDEPLTDAVARRDRIDYLDSIRGSLYRLLYVVDFTLVHERVDRLMLRDAREALVDGVDAVDACLLIDGVGAQEPLDDA